MTEAPPRGDADSTQRRAAVNARKMVDVVAGVGERIMRRSQPVPAPAKVADVDVDAAADDEVSASDEEGSDTKREAS